jgi:serine/threonine protein kinase
MQVKIGDFGLACMDNICFNEKDKNILTEKSPSSSLASSPVSPFTMFKKDTAESSKSKESKSALRDRLEHTRGVGTWLYASPEQLLGKHYDTKVFICFYFCSFF